MHNIFAIFVVSPEKIRFVILLVKLKLEEFANKQTLMLAIHTACIHNLLMRELCGLHHYSLLPAVSGAVCQVSCLPTLSLGASDEWDCHSQGHLAAR